MYYFRNLRRSLFYGLFITFIFIQNKSYSQESLSLKDRKVEVVFTGGAWLNTPSKIWVDDIGDYSTKSISALIKAMGDVYLNPHFALGLYLNFSPGYTHNNISVGNTTVLFEYGAGFKPVFYFSDKTAMKIGANVGWRTHGSGYSGVDGHGLGVNCSIEIQHLILNKGSITFEPGFLSQPVGYANDDTERYAYAPIFYLNIGYTFSVFGT